MIIGVAFMHPGDEIMFSMRKPKRHHDLVKQLSEMGHTPEYISECDQGFIDEDWNYMNRKDAAEYAIKAGQIETLQVPPNLYSEDLW